MGRSRKLRLETEENYPELFQFVAAYLHQDWPEDSGTPEAAIDQAIADRDHAHRKIVASEWWSWNAKVGSINDPRRAINDGLGANIHFSTPLEARNFMNSIYDKLIVAIRKEEKGWKP